MHYTIFYYLNTLYHTLLSVSIILYSILFISYPQAYLIFFKSVHNPLFKYTISFPTLLLSSTPSSSKLFKCFTAVNLVILSLFSILFLFVYISLKISSINSLEYILGSFSLTSLHVSLTKSFILFLYFTTILCFL